jgi:hypothetical protein
MKKITAIIFLTLSLISCQNVSVNNHHVPEPDPDTNTGITLSLPYMDSFNTVGPLISPWSVTFTGEPIPTATSGVLTTTASNSAYIPGLSTTNVYSEIEFHNAGGSTNFNFNLLNRYDDATHSALWCSFSMRPGGLNVSFMAMNNGVLSSSSFLTLPVFPSDTAIYKAGCLIETNGADVLLTAYLDPSGLNTTPVGSYSFIGFQSIIPSGSPGLVIEDTSSDLILDNFGVHSAFPY